ncbi:MAG: Stp1/IreP family PP2C-type Ser/Thr phosphatase [Lachnospiraceae bacterium]|nr:Stp1/IreP family PP2C-type Ser/Thr phosphatase [Lachnospiraceae bacterium]
MGKTVSRTDIGLKRKLNQDYVFTADLPVGKLPNLYLVADGMGGHKAGGFASKYAVETIVEEVNINKEENVFVVLNQAIAEANYRIRKKASEDESMAGMGTTLVAATIMGDVLYVANVGDSRLYLANEEMKQITIDHSLVEEMVRMGGINREQARNHENKNIITRAIGAQSTVNPDFFEVNLKKGDRIFMCTDGVSNMLTDDEIFQILNEDKSDEEKIEEIITQANEHGGRDNMGIILVTPQL